MFSIYYERYAKLAASDLNLLQSPPKFSKLVLAYMYATMNEKTRKIVVNNNFTLEEMTFALLTTRHCLNVKNIKKFNLLPNPSPHCKSWRYLLTLSKKCSSPFGEDVLELLYPSFCQKVEQVSEKTLFNLFDYLLKHEILHILLNAPLNRYGEIFVVKTSLILELEPICQWSDFDMVVEKSKFIPIEWKKEKEIYGSNVISPNSKEIKDLLNELAETAKNKSKHLSIKEITNSGLSKILSIKKLKTI